MCEVPLAVEDSELIDSYRATGCRDSLDELARRYLGRMRNVVYQMVLDDEAADDLTQEVMLRALRGLANFNGQAAFSTWIYRIAMNTVYSFLARRRQSPLCFPGELPESVDDAADSPELAAMQAELDGRIAQALDNLSPKLRAAIVLTTLHHWSPAQAAEIEGCSTGTMYWRIHEARAQLQGQLATWLKI
jgi:RNA polymerase sigma-70 factor, ECF subfamily